LIAAHQIGLFDRRLDGLGGGFLMSLITLYDVSTTSTHIAPKILTARHDHWKAVIAIEVRRLAKHDQFAIGAPSYRLVNLIDILIVESHLIAQQVL